MNRQHDIEPSRQDEDDWLCTVEFLPSNDPEGRVFAADIVGYLFGTAEEVEAMVKLANELKDSTIAWLHRFHPELLKP
jgi:hypothetical protein